MSAISTASGKALKKFKAAKVMTISELMQLMGCSLRTAHRRLKDWGALSSYNQNGRYYTLRQIARFDEDGLWHCRSAFFSRHGNLIETALTLIQAAPAGLTAAELGRKLGVNAHSFVSRLKEHSQVRRERIGGKHVYFCSDCFIAQSGRRRQPQAGLPGDAEAVVIFAEMLRCPELGLDQICARLEERGMRIDETAVEQLLGRHGLGKKSRTASTLSSPCAPSSTV